MKRVFFIFVIFAVCAFASFARTPVDEEHASTPVDKEQDGKLPVKNGLSFNLSAGLFYTNNPKTMGGHFETGFNLFKNVILVQNRFLLRAGGFFDDNLDTTVITLSEKLVFAREEEEFVRFYIYLEGGAGFYGNSKNSFSLDTLVYSFGFGGGFELGDNTLGALYIEFGYLGLKITANFPLSGCVIQAGWRIYL